MLPATSKYKENGTEGLLKSNRFDLQITDHLNVLTVKHRTKLKTACMKITYIERIAQNSCLFIVTNIASAYTFSTHFPFYLFFFLLPLNFPFLCLHCFSLSHTLSLPHHFFPLIDSSGSLAMRESSVHSQQGGHIIAQVFDSGVKANGEEQNCSFFCILLEEVRSAALPQPISGALHTSGFQYHSNCDCEHL